jgi:thiol-disulfide isomerase/thioredoxin
MRNILTYLIVLLAIVTLTQCNSTDSTSVISTENSNTLSSSTPSIEGKPVKITGSIKNGGGLKIYFDRVTLDAIESLDNTTIEGNGEFKITLESVTPSPYRLRIGQKSILLFLEGTEGAIHVQADLSTIDNLDYKTSNSPNTTSFVNIIQVLRKKGSQGGEKAFAENIFNFVDTTSYPLVGLYLTTLNFDPKRYQYPSLPLERILAIHQRANDKFKAAYPGSDLLQTHNRIIGEMRMAASQQSVRIGSVPPDITMQSPEGKTYSLSQLKGKVVLLDFWASWCGPCRKTNPELVRIYEKFKNKNFTVFSVSLDRNEQAWRQAIFKDNLTWEYHVSDLQYWNSTAAKLYNVTSIPQTFLINKDGTVAAMNLFPGPQLEQEIQKLL